MLANEWLKLIVENGIEESYVIDAESFRFLLVNRQAQHNLGYEAAELEMMTPWAIKPEIDEAEFRVMIAPLESGAEEVVRFNTVHRRKDGSLYDVKVRMQRLESAKNAVFFAAIEDVTLFRRAARALRQATERLDAIVNNTRMALFMMDNRQHCMFMNAAAEAMTGYTLAEMQGRRLHDVIHHTHPDGRPFPIADCSIDRALLGHDQQSGEDVFVHRDGSFYPIGFTASRMRSEDGETIGTVIEAKIISDELRAREASRSYNETLEREIELAVAQRNAAEAQLFQAQKMEAIGNLTGGVAHDFNNILQVIKGNLELLAHNAHGDDAAERRIAHAMTGVSRGAKLTSQLLAFGRRQPLEPQALNLGRLLHGLDDMLRRLLGETVDIEVIASGGLWNCSIDRAQMENAILNLAINGRDAMEGRGKLTLEVSNAVLDDQYASGHDEVTAGQYVMLAVTDTGCGIAPDVLDHVFEPFFTTKAEGQGTGLGLSMVYGFIKQSSGHIKLYSEIDHGTTVRLYLPRVFQPEGAQDEPLLVEVHGGSETILVVEDDEAVRTTVVETLVELGYRVLKAANADNALAIVESGVQIDLLFTDVVMPGTLRSTDLARLTVAAHPHVAVLFASGYTQNAIVHVGRLDPGVELLSKPYGRETLARKIRQVLEKRRTLEIAATSGEQVAHARSLRILAVEDEPLIRMLLVDMLTDMGHDVVDADNVAGALTILQTAEFDILLTDVSLPDGSGIELASYALSHAVDTRVILATGQSRDGQSWPPSCILLQKPYDERALTAALAGASRD